MKSISKRIKSIYLLAIMAILSICLAVFPVFKTDKVTAEGETQPNLSMTGAKVKFSTTKGADDFALMFQAEISKTFYTSIEGQQVEFGMAIFPETHEGVTLLDSITDYDSLLALQTAGDAEVFASIVGTLSSDATQKIDFDPSKDAFEYEAGTYFCKTEAGYESVTADEWKNMYATNLIAIPFYTTEVDNVKTVTFDKALASTATSAKQVTIDTMYAETALPAYEKEGVETPVELKRAVTDENFTAVTGINVAAFTYDKDGKPDIYLNRVSTAKLAFFTDFVKGGNGTSSSAGNPANTEALRLWGICKSSNATSSSWMSGYVAGQKQLKNMSNHTANAATFTTSFFADLDAFMKLIPGETYRYYYMDGSVLKYFDYIVATEIFTATTAISGNQGSIFYPGIVLGGALTSSTAMNYFALRLNSSNLEMPQSRIDAGFTKKDGYNGYYVLANDFVLAPNSSSVIKSPTYDATTGKSITIMSAPANTNGVNCSLMASLKHVPRYINTINPISGAVSGFTGTFDGRGQTISASFNRGGLFGAIKGGTVKNLNIEADLYYYETKTTTSPKVIEYKNSSYSEKAAVLAELILDGSTIENVSITLKENAPKTFAYYGTKLDGSNEVELDTPEFDNVPGLLASQTIMGANTKLTNVIVRCDSLKDAGNSMQNFRAALNLDSSIKASNLKNVFVIGSSYSDMSIAEADADPMLTISVSQLPEGIADYGTYAVADYPEALTAYGNMACDMYKYMRKASVDLNTMKIKFVAERATKKFANDADFNAYLNGEEGAAAKTELTATGMWKEEGDSLVWAYTTSDVTLTPSTSYAQLQAKPIVDEANNSVNVFGWADFVKYEVTLVY